MGKVILIGAFIGGLLAGVVKSTFTVVNAAGNFAGHTFSAVGGHLPGTIRSVTDTLSEATGIQEKTVVPSEAG